MDAPQDDPLTALRSAEERLAAAEKSLAQVKAHLHEQHHLAEAMRRAYEQERADAEALRSAAALKDDFLSIVSHELRTPLTSILGFATLLEDAPEADRPEFAHRIRRNAEEMHHMIERLLDFSRLQGGAVMIRPMRLRLADVVRHAIAGLRNLARADRVDIDVDESLEVVADPDGLTHVLSNLLANAEKFAPVDSRLEVAARPDGGSVEVAVRDHGPGIPLELQSKVFERFFQAGPAPSGRHGTGVGLAIVREYVELLGGRTWCESVPGNGATFLFTLPVPA
jgi:signal transduction histidine kinase